MATPTILDIKRKARARAEQYLDEGQDSILVMYDDLSREFHPAVARTVVWDLLSEGKVTFTR